MQVAGTISQGNNFAQTYLPLRQWGAGNVYLLLLSSWKVNIAKNQGPIYKRLLDDSTEWWQKPLGIEEDLYCKMERG